MIIEFVPSNAPIPDTCCDSVAGPDPCTFTSSNRAAGIVITRDGYVAPAWMIGPVNVATNAATAPDAVAET